MDIKRDTGYEPRSEFRCFSLASWGMRCDEFSSIPLSTRCKTISTRLQTLADSLSHSCSILNPDAGNREVSLFNKCAPPFQAPQHRDPFWLREQDPQL